MNTSNKIIKATPNYSKRTYTIRVYFDGKLSSKYRTIPMSKEEFYSNEINTNEDCKQFLKSNEYYIVK